MTGKLKGLLGLVAGGLALMVVSGALGGATAGPGAGKSVGVVYFLNADTPSAIIGKAYADSATKLGYSVSGVDSQGSPANAVTAIQNFVQKGVDAIVVQLWQVNQVRAGITAANAAGIPVIGVSSNALGGTKGYRLVTQFGPASGKVLGNYIVSKTKGGGAALVIGYSPGTVAHTREQGLMKALKGKGVKVTRNELNVTDINASTANSVNAWLGNNAKGSAANLFVWVPSSCCVVPAVNAIRQAGRSDVKVYGFLDGTKAAVRPLKQGYVQALAADDLAGQGAAAAKATLAVINGGPTGPQKVLTTLPQLVTKANLNAYLAKHPELK